MPQIGPLEILVIGVIALMVFGPEKLPGMARSVGRGVNQLKAMALDVKSEFDTAMSAEEASSPQPGSDTTIDHDASAPATAPETVLSAGKR